MHQHKVPVWRCQREMHRPVSPIQDFQGIFGLSLAERVKQQPRAEGFDEILMPGEPEARIERERLASGIPLTHDVLKSLQSEGRLVEIPFPSDLA